MNDWGPIRDGELDKPGSERCESCLATLIQKVSNCDLLIAHYDSEITRLEYQIEERKKKYNIWERLRSIRRQARRLFPGRRRRWAAPGRI
jgi:hypothetical protein